MPDYTSEPESTCNGLCLSASDIGVHEVGDVVAYAHPDCEAHGDAYVPVCTCSISPYQGPDRMCSIHGENAPAPVLTDDFGQPLRECYGCDRVGCPGCVPAPKLDN